MNASILAFRRSWFAVLLAATLTASAPAVARGATHGPDSLATGWRQLDLQTIESRRAALADLEARVLAAPDQAELWTALARTALASQRPRRGREALEIAATIAPEDARVQVELGRIWKQYWLAAMDSTDLLSAYEAFGRAAKQDPANVDARVELATLSILRGRPLVAAELASRACLLDSTRGDARLVLGCALTRLGRFAQARAALASATAWLPEDMTRRLEDDAWFLENTFEEARETGHLSASSARAYWTANDPDLTTPENEAELDYRSRIALVLLLFRRGDEVRWDERCELFVRYGPPTQVAVNPNDSPFWGYQYPRRSFIAYVPPPIPYPFQRQVWMYPEYGIRFDLWDQSLRGLYRPAITDGVPRATASAAALSGKADVVVLQGGLGVFRTMPPGSRLLPIAAEVSRLPAGERTRLLVHATVPSSGADWVASCAVSDADGRVLQRVAQSMALSACWFDEERVAEFSLDVPEGRYRVDVSVNDSEHGRGLVRRAIEIATAQPGPRMSDLVLICGSANAPGLGEQIRLEPNLRHVVPDREALSAYFEVSGLERGEDGVARFTYSCAIRRLESRRRVAARLLRDLEVTREVEQPEDIRRQVLEVPVASLPEGRYSLSVTVRDAVSGLETTRRTEFARRAK
ncbi:MAG: hypothetical protein HZA61_12655 [Candidatus Eisenbacteria bacterium]|uniref:GWxTD domain-containing protein n=1 Tax=Eiseniibacteriota bacterium TaxID=2212470 RepID=A0A933SFE1_UNCEI|nr:hypothetical protein [Candidatus Eisenbacteria bacterium]